MITGLGNGNGIQMEKVEALGRSFGIGRKTTSIIT